MGGKWKVAWDKKSICALSVSVVGFQLKIDGARFHWAPTGGDKHGCLTAGDITLRPWYTPQLPGKFKNWWSQNQHGKSFKKKSRIQTGIQRKYRNWNDNHYKIYLGRRRHRQLLRGKPKHDQHRVQGPVCGHRRGRCWRRWMEKTKADLRPSS